MTRKQGIIRRALSLLEGPVDNVTTRAKGWNAPAGLDLTQDPTRTFRSMRNLRNIYLQGAYIAEGVDLFPLYAIGNGYELEIDEDLGDGEQQKQDVQEFLNRINFYDVMWQLMVDAETVRDGVAEIVMGRGALGQVPVNVVPRPAECFEFDTTEKGTITSYSQMCDNRGNTIQKITLKPEQVLHYQFLSRTDSPYGISIVERVVHDIKRDTKVAEAITAGICLHGTPKWHVKVNSTNTDAAQISDSDMAALETQFEKFNAKDQFITEGDVLVEALDTAGVQNVQMYSDVTLTRVVAGLGIPGELLGLRQGTTDATAVTRVGAFFKKIKSCQRDIEQLWNTQIIDKITGIPGLVKLKLSDTDPQDFAKMAAAFAQLRTGSDPDAVAPADWCREQLGVPADERTPEEKPQKQEFPAGFGGFPFGQQAQDRPPEYEEKPEEAALNELAAAAHALSEAVRVPRAMADEGRWVTINGAHILIKDGESAGDAFKRTTGKDLGGHSFSKAGKTVSTNAVATTRSDSRDADIVVAVNGKKTTIKASDVHPNKDSPTGYTMDVGGGDVARDFAPNTKQNINLSIDKETHDILKSNAKAAIQARAYDESAKPLSKWSYEYGVDTGTLHIRPEGVDPIWHDTASKTRADIASLNIDQKAALGSELNKVSKQGVGGRYEVSDTDVNTALTSAKQYKSQSTIARKAEIDSKISIAKSTGRDQIISTVLVEAKGNEDLPAVETYVKPDGTTYKKRVDYH